MIQTAIARAIYKAVSESDYTDELEALNAEIVYSPETEALEVRIMHSHSVDIYTVEIKRRETFSG